MFSSLAQGTFDSLVSLKALWVCSAWKETSCTWPLSVCLMVLDHLNWPQVLFLSISRDFKTPYLLCDCNLLWLLRWIRDRKISVRNTECSYPQSLQGQSVTSIRPELFTCGTETHTHTLKYNCLNILQQNCIILIAADSDLPFVLS